MLPVSTPHATVDGSSLRDVMHNVVETLAAIERRPCSPGEREAAEWLAARLRRVEGTEVTLEDEPSWGTFPPTATGLGVVGMLAAAFGLRGRRRRSALLAALSIAGIVDEAQNGPRIVRRLVRRRRATVNVLASVEAREPGARRSRGTLVVLAHHDAPQTGLVFDQTLQRRLHEVAPQVLESVKTPFPNWWMGLSGPVAAGAAALTGSRRLARAALLMGTLTTGLAADMWRSQTVQAQTTTSPASRRWSRSPSCCASGRCPACGCCSSRVAPRRRCRTASAPSSPATAASSIRSGRGS
jgi:hypothetical protein